MTLTCCFCITPSMMDRSSGVRCERSGPWLPWRGSRGGRPRPWRSPSKEDSWFILRKKQDKLPVLLSLPQRENCFSQQQGQGHTLRVVCERKRAEEALFLQYDPALCRLSHHPQEISPWIVKMEWSTTMPSPSLTSCPALLCSWGGAEVGGGAGVVRSSCRPHHHRGCD